MPDFGFVTDSQTLLNVRSGLILLAAVSLILITLTVIFTAKEIRHSRGESDAQSCADDGAVSAADDNN